MKEEVIRMPSPIFDAMNSQQPASQPTRNPYEMVRQFGAFKQDPFGFMMKRRGINIPQEYRNDPQAAVQYLINSGTLTPQDLDYLKGVAINMGIQLPI